jgi:proteasome lid subunit RPN8/RPN11
MILKRTATIVLPADAGRTMLSILQIMRSSNLEYGIYLKGTWHPEDLTVRVLPGQFYLPEQEVTGATIKFTEEPPGPDWNVVIHRHPPGVNSFSGTDQQSINEEFLASLIFMPPWGFPAAIVNVPIVRGVKLQVDASVVVDGEMFEGQAELRQSVKDKISLRTPHDSFRPGLDGAAATDLLNKRQTLQNQPGRSIPADLGVPKPSGKGSVTLVELAPSDPGSKKRVKVPGGVIQRLPRLPVSGSFIRREDRPDSNDNDAGYPLLPRFPVLGNFTRRESEPGSNDVPHTDAGHPAFGGFTRADFEEIEYGSLLPAD